jgi:hypothetical protein
MIPTVNANLEKFLHRLQADLARVEASQATEEQKKQVRELTHHLRHHLDNAPAAWPAVVQQLTPMIAELNYHIGVIVGDPMGACEYDGGCIVTTEAQCKGLGGKWSQDTPCPSITSGTL